MCKSHYVECLIKELCIDNSLGNPTYTPTTLTKEETLDNHMSFYIPLDSRLQSYPHTNYSRGGVNQMWILKNSKDLLEYIQTRPRSSCKSIKTFDFSTLYTTISHSKLKDRLRELVLLCFIKKNGQRRYKYLVLGRDISSFIKKNTTLILPKILWSWYHQHSRVFDWQHICYICFSTYSRHTYGYKLADLFLYLYVADFIQWLLKKNEKKASPIL